MVPNLLSLLPHSNIDSSFQYISQPYYSIDFHFAKSNRDSFVLIFLNLPTAFHTHYYLLKTFSSLHFHGTMFSLVSFTITSCFFLFSFAKFYPNSYCLCALGIFPEPSALLYTFALATSSNPIVFKRYPYSDDYQSCVSSPNPNTPQAPDSYSQVPTGQFHSNI